MFHFNIETQSHKMFRIFVIVALSMTLTTADNTNKVNFILDFLDSQIKPTKLVVWRNCFDESELLELFKRSFISINKQDSLIESDFGVNPHYWLFVLDLTCTSTQEQISQKVNSSSSTLSLSLLAFSFLTLLSIPFSHSIDWRDAVFASISVDNVHGWWW